MATFWEGLQDPSNSTSNRTFYVGSNCQFHGGREELVEKLENEYQRLARTTDWDTEHIAAAVQAMCDELCANATATAGMSEEWVSLRVASHVWYLAPLTLIVVAGLVGNALQLYLTGQPAVRMLCFSVYLRCLAVVDSTILLHVVAEDYINIFGYPYETSDYLGSSIHFCRFWNWMTLSTRHLSPWLVVAFTCQRWVAVTFPLKARLWCTHRSTVAICVVLTMVWVAQPFVFVVPMLEVEHFEGRVVNLTDCVPRFEAWVGEFNQIDIVFPMTLLPSALILVFNVGIITGLRNVRRTRQKLKPTDATDADKGKNSSSDDAKTSLALISVSMLTFLTLSPKAIIEATEYFTEHRVRLNIWRVFNWVEMLNFSQNFYMLMITGRNYRSIMKERFSQLMGKKMKSGK